MLNLFRKFIFIPIFFSLFFTSCSSLNPFSSDKEKKASYSKHIIGEQYRSVALSKFFLQEVPEWLNFSESGQCKREHKLKFFNYEKIRQNFGLDYPKAVHFQNLYNVAYRTSLKKTNGQFLPQKEEEKIFFETLEKVKANQSIFQSPAYPVVNLFWIDNLVNRANKRDISKLKRFLSSRKGGRGYPIFISLCYSKASIQRFLKENRFENGSIKIMSLEMFSIYNQKNKKVPHFSIHLDSFFSKTQKLNLYIPRGRIPREFNGRAKIQYLAR